MIHAKRLFAVVWLMGLVLWGTPNALFNGDFSFGSEGFILYRLLDDRLNPEQRYVPLACVPGEGGNELEIANDYGDYFQLRSAEFTLPGDTQVRFRARGVSSASCQLIFAIARVDVNGRWHLQVRHAAMEANQEGGVDFTFRTGKERSQYILVVHPAGTPPKGKIRIRQLHITGEEKSPLLAVVKAQSTLYTLEESSSAAVTLSLYNSLAQPQKGQLLLEVYDQTFGGVLWRQEMPAELPSGRRDFTFQCPLSRYGAFSFRVSWEGKPVRCIPGAFAVIGEYHGKEDLDIRRDFCVGINAGSGYLSRGRDIGGYGHSGVSTDEKFAMLARMGCRLVRDWGGSKIAANWYDMEPSEGRFDFSYFDRVVDLTAKNNMTLMPVFGQMYEVPATARPIRPLWLQPRLRHIEKNPPGTNPKFVVKVPPQEAWVRYVTAFARHAGKRVKAYEIMNEPNLNLSPELYMSYMLTAAKAIKSAAPEAQVVGVCVTGDQDGELVHYLKRCVELGALPALDAVSFHPYNGRELGSAFAADRQIRELQSIVGEKPLWNTELFYPYDHPDTMNYDAQQRPEARHAACRFLVDLGEGLAQSTASEELVLWQQPLHPTLYPHYRTQLIPNSLFVAYNALARHFEAAKPVSRIKLDSGLVIYIYRRQGKLQAALWMYRDNGAATVDLQGLAAMDLFGNPLKDNVVPLDGNPIYILSGALSEDEFMNRMRRIRPEFATPVGMPQVARRVGEHLWFSAQNLTAAAMDSSWGFQGGGWRSAGVKESALPADGIAHISLPLEASPECTEPPQLSCAAGNRWLKAPVRLYHSQFAYAGQELLAQWADGTAAAVGGLRRVAGGLEVELRVYDSTPSGKNGKRMLWESDGVELFFDLSPRALGGEAEKYTPQVFRAFVNPHDGTPLTLWNNAIAVADCQYRCEKFPDGYQVRLTIPCKVVGDEIGFGYVIHDAKSEGEKAWRSARWGAAGDSFWNRLTFGVVDLREDATAIASEDVGVFHVPLEIEAMTGGWQGDTTALSIQERRSKTPTVVLAAEVAGERFYRLSFRSALAGDCRLGVAMRIGTFNDAVVPYCGSRVKGCTEYFYAPKDGRAQFFLSLETGSRAKIEDIRLVEVEPNGRELFVNGDFEVEDGLGFWHQNSFDESLFPGSVAASTGRFYGKNALALTFSASGIKHRISSRYFPIPLGSRLRVSFWAKAQGDGNQVLDMVLNMYPRSGVHKGEHRLYWQKIVVTPEWRRFSLDFTPGEDVEKYPDLLRRLVKLQLFPQGNASGQVLVDDISCRILPVNPQ